MSEKKIYCQFNEELSVSELKKKINPKNRNKHPKEQIERLAKILLKNGVRHPIVVSNLSGLITKGHGRLEAAILNGWSSYPVQFQDYENQEQEFADAIADNAIASWAELDLENIQVDLKDLSSDFDIDLMGIDNFQIESHDQFAGKDADHVPETKENELGVKTGDLWILGNHRLLCGDATKKEDVERLMSYYQCDCGEIHA